MQAKEKIRNRRQVHAVLRRKKTKAASMPMNAATFQLQRILQHIANNEGTNRKRLMIKRIGTTKVKRRNKG